MDGGCSWEKFRKMRLGDVIQGRGGLLIMEYGGNLNNFNVIYVFNKGGGGV